MSFISLCHICGVKPYTNGLARPKCHGDYGNTKFKKTLYKCFISRKANYIITVT